MPTIEPTRWHTVVVGAGLAGAETARELHRRGVPDVVVLEAGPQADSRHINLVNPPEAALRTWLQPETDPYFSQPWTSCQPPNYTGSSGIRRRVGGRSLYWHGVVLPVEPWALASDWPTVIVSDLVESWRGGESLYARVSRMLDSWRGEPASGPGSACQLGTLRLSPVPLAVRPAAGRPDRWYAYSPLDDWRDPESGRARDGVDLPRIFPDAEVTGVTVRAGRATGVRLQHAGVPLEIEADRVVLAAGTMENSRLAIQALHDAGAARPRLPGLFDHLVQGVFVCLDPARAERLCAVIEPTTYFLRIGETARANLFLDLRPRADRSLLMDLQVTVEQLPSERNYVECRPGPDPVWPVTVRASPSSADLEALASARETLLDAWRQICEITGEPVAPLRFDDFRAPVRTNEFVLPEHLSSVPAGRPVTWSGFLGTEDHEGGTLALGRRLTDDHEFRQVSGLFAAGPCTFPRMGASNPALTTLALAHRLAAVLAEE